MKKYDIKQIAKYYFIDKYSLNKIAKIINVSPTTIGNQLKKHGYVLDNKSHDGNNRKHYIDKDFFKIIDTKNKAYILGLIISDGYVDDYAKLTFTSKDIELVEIFRSELKSEHKLAKYDVFDKRTDKTYTRYSLQIASKEIVNDLNKLGIFSKKSFNCMMPNIPNELFWHFIRGLFDGDGSISKETKKKLGALRFKIIGSENLINAIKTKFIQFGLSNTKISITKYSSNNNRLVSIHYYSFKDLSLLKQKIYEDSENLRLTRKYELFQTLKEYRHGTYNRTKKLRKLEMYDYLTNKYIKTFNNIHDICNEFNTKPESIYRVIRGNRNHFNGYFFKY
jgi:ribosomal protein S8